MLADARSESLVTNFAAQWLYLRDVEVKKPDLFLFRDFDEGLRESFEKETELFLNSILREKIAASLDLLTANYTFVNERLAKHYGIPNITAANSAASTLPEGQPARAGLLGQGSILTADVVFHADIAGAAREIRSGESAGVRRHRRLRRMSHPSRPKARKPVSRCLCATRWCSIGPTPPAPIATPAWTRSDSRWKISTRSASGATGCRQAHRCYEHARGRHRGQWHRRREATDFARSRAVRRARSLRSC